MASPRGGLREEADPGEEVGVVATGLTVAAKAGQTGQPRRPPAVQEGAFPGPETGRWEARSSPRGVPGRWPEGPAGPEGHESQGEKPTLTGGHPYPPPPADTSAGVFVFWASSPLQRPLEGRGWGRGSPLTPSPPPASKARSGPSRGVGARKPPFAQERPSGSRKTGGRVHRLAGKAPGSRQDYAGERPGILGLKECGVYAGVPPPPRVEARPPSSPGPTLPREGVPGPS